MGAQWWELPLAAVDTETTGVNVEADRIVTAGALVVAPDGTITTRREWLADPGVEIPAEATKIHKVTTEQARAHGRPAREVVAELAAGMRRAWGYGTPMPIVVMNASYDLTLIQRELARHGLPLLDVGPVLDPFVIDRACDPWRKGTRKLVDLVAHYGVKASEAHNALGDAEMAVGVLRRQIEIGLSGKPWGDGVRGKADYSPLRMSLADLQVWQARSHAARQADYQNYLRTKARPPQPSAVVDGSWPWRPPADAGGARVVCVLERGN